MDKAALRIRVTRTVFVASVFVLAAGAWIFLHPATPPLRAETTSPMAPIDERAGVYDGADGAQLLLPGVNGGHVLYTVDRWFYTRQLDEDALAATLSGDVLTVSGDGGSRRYVRRAGQPYTVKAVETVSDVALEGWLFEPTAPSGAGAVILHGSGDSDRTNGWYVYLADELASAGVTVILPDKRGSGRSGGDWRDAEFSVLAEDGKVWFDRLRKEKPALSRAGFVGVSQGGSIAPLAARLAGADFAVALSSSATTMREQLAAEVANEVAAAGVPEFLQAPVTAAFAARARGRYPAFWRANGDYDMPAEWRRWGGPFFIAYGREDEHDNVPVAKSLQRLEGEFGNEPNLSWRVYEGAGHALVGADQKFIPAFRDDLLAAVRERD